MNFLTINHKSSLLFFIYCFLLSIQVVNSQNNIRILPVETILQLDPVPQNRIFSVTRNTRGILYIGTNGKLYRYDGKLSFLGDLDGEVKLASTAGGRVYAAGSSEILWISPAGEANERVTRIATPSSLRIHPILEMATQGEELIILSESKVYLYSPPVFKLFNLKTPARLIPLGEDSILIAGLDGYYRITHKELKPISDPALSSLGIPELWFRDSLQCWLRFPSGKWYTYRKGVVRPESPPLSRVELSRNAEQIEADPAGGFWVKNKQGELLFFPSNSSLGYSLHFIPSFSNSQQGKILSPSPYEKWIITDFSIQRPGNGPEVTYFPYKTAGIQGLPVKIFQFEGRLYVLSDQGLFCSSGTIFSDVGESDALMHFSSIPVPFKILDIITDTPFPCIVHATGFSFPTANQQWNTLPCPGIQKAIYNPRKQLLYLFNGMEIHLYRIHATRKAEKLASHSLHLPEVSSVALESNGNIWFQVRSGIVYVYSGGEKGYPLKLIESKNLPGEDATWNLIKNYGEEVYYLSSHGVYQFISQNRSWKKFEDQEGSGPFWFYPMSRDPENHLLWAVSHSDLAPDRNCVVSVDSAGKMKEYYLSRRQDYKISAMYADGKGILWLATPEAFLRYDTRKNSWLSLNSKTLITEIEFGKKNYSLAELLESKSVKRIAYKNNSISVRYVNSLFGNQDRTLYQYMLEGFMDEPSAWVSSASIEFFRLPPGHYTFWVKSKVLPGEESMAEKFHFTISTPVYLKWYAVLFYLFIIIASVLIFIRWRSWRFMQEKIRLEDLISLRTEELRKEKEKTDQILANILPKDTADEIKKKGKASSQKFEMVTVLFSDIQGFTRIAEQMNPETLIDQLDVFYLQFDSVVEKYNIEKIKTIGDAYMCAGGIPDKNRTNPVEVVLAGLEMQQYMKELKAQNSNIWDLRIGIHTGPVIAGVIGQKKFSYDIWGDTVNTASRMESSGEPGKVNISGHTYELVRDFFICEYRGKMPVKYKGEIDMYFVKGIRPELSLNLKGLPNQRFFLQLQNLRIIDLEEFIVENLEKAGEAKLVFHHLNYAIDVYTQAELLGRAEGLSEEELLVTRTAGLFSTIGYTLDFNRAGEKAAEFVAQVLPRYKYTEHQVAAVSHLLLQDVFSMQAETQLEKIFSDACLSFIGRAGFAQSLDLIFAENLSFGRQQSREEFGKFIIGFLQSHRYYTFTARKLMEVGIHEQLKVVEEWVLSGS